MGALVILAVFVGVMAWLLSAEMRAERKRDAEYEATLAEQYLRHAGARPTAEEVDEVLRSIDKK